MDMAVVNVPLKQRGNLNAEIDRNKRALAAESKQQRREQQARRVEARELSRQHLAAMVREFGSRPAFAAKKASELRDTLDQMAKWKPGKFIVLVQAWLDETA